MWLLFACNFCVNIDMGILPACTLKMTKELNLDTANFGLLGSIVYVGQFLGCLLAAYMFQKVDERHVLPCGLTLNLLTLILFTYSEEFWSMLLCRLFTGSFQ